MYSYTIIKAEAYSSQNCRGPRVRPTPTANITSKGLRKEDHLLLALGMVT